MSITAKNRIKKVQASYRQEVLSDLSQISDSVQRRRKALGLTQEELAETLDIAPKTIQSIEQRQRFPSLPMLVYICRVLGVRLRIDD